MTALTRKVQDASRRYFYPNDAEPIAAVPISRLAFQGKFRRLAGVDGGGVEQGNGRVLLADQQ